MNHVGVSELKSDGKKIQATIYRSPLRLEPGTCGIWLFSGMCRYSMYFVELWDDLC